MRSRSASCARAASSASRPSPSTPSSTATPLHVRYADEAYALGGQTAAESYLNTDAILDVIEQRRAPTAVHPGYGFFSENADFARALTDAGVAWIGPPPEAIEIMGDKISSRKAAAARRRRVGARHARPDHRRARDRRVRRRARLADRDQGRVRRRRQGMKVVAERRRAPRRRSSRRTREAQAYFGRPECYIERYLTRPRHVEIQVFCDTHGNVRVPRRPRLLDAAPPPEADRGGARARLADATRARDGRGRGEGRASRAAT